MASDANITLQASTTKTASFNSTGVDLKTGTPRRGLVARLRVTAASGTTPTLDGKIQESNDNSAWNDLCSFDQLTTTGIQYATFETEKRYVRLVATIAGTSPSFTYDCDVLLGRP